MFIIEWGEKIISKMKWYDISLIKIVMIFFTLFVVTAWAGFREVALSVALYWHLILMILQFLHFDLHGWTICYGLLTKRN